MKTKILFVTHDPYKAMKIGDILIKNQIWYESLSIGNGYGGTNYEISVEENNFDKAKELILPF